MPHLDLAIYFNGICQQDENNKQIKTTIPEEPPWKFHWLWNLLALQNFKIPVDNIYHNMIPKNYSNRKTKLTSALAAFSFFFFMGFSLSAAVLSPSRAYNFASRSCCCQQMTRKATHYNKWRETSSLLLHNSDSLYES